MSMNQVENADGMFYQKLREFLQVNLQTFLIDDYKNSFEDISTCLYNYEESITFKEKPETTANIFSRIIKTIQTFKTYREYLYSQAKSVNQLYCGNQMTDIDCREFAEQLYLMAPNGEAMDQLSIDFRTELASVRTPDDIPRLKTMLTKYWLQALALFNGIR